MKICEDNDAVLKLLIKQRNPRLRPVVRTHRVNADFIFKVVHDDDCISAGYVNPKVQIADMMTKASFTNDQWKNLCSLAQIGPVDKKLFVSDKDSVAPAKILCLQKRKLPYVKTIKSDIKAWPNSKDYDLADTRHCKKLIEI